MYIIYIILYYIILYYIILYYIILYYISVYIPLQNLQKSHVSSEHTVHLCLGP